ncbi:MAG: hypothetical protein R3E50_08015 [Halioglobus sp.]
MLKYFLILFVVALALAPLVQFLPSKRQRKLARMREYAALHGLFVEFRDAPEAPGGPAPPRDAIYYGKRLPTRRAAPVETAAWVHARQGWRCVAGGRSVPEQLQQLPGDILAASVDQSSCGVYWTEASGEEVVEQIQQVLERWSDALTH